MQISEWVFWFSLGFIFYAYLGYPLLLVLLAPFRSRKVVKGDILPRVSFIIAAYNEKSRISQKLQNTLEQDYPPERLEIIVTSDCSMDGTDEVVKGYAGQGVRLLRAAHRGGKENAQKLGVDHSKGEILIFSDVATRLESGAVRKIVRNFGDPSVGCVSSIDRFINQQGQVSGEGLYVKYEMLLRRLESRTGSLVGLSGSFFAARREVCYPWATDQQSDFNTLINSVKNGYRGVIDPESAGYYQDLSDGTQEFSRKVRTVTRGINVFLKNTGMLNPFRYGLFSLQFCSHKFCRWLVPYAMLVHFGTNFMLAGRGEGYLLWFSLQVLFYLLATAGILLPATGGLLRVPVYFLLVNLSIAAAWFKYLQGEQFVKWDPSVR
jgi:glycosyltransferase involved in cell wall biosynthesis